MRFKYNAPVVLTFGLICAIVLIVSQFMSSSFMHYFMIGPSLQQTPSGVLGLFTHVLGHSGWDHLLGNMTFILLIGPIIEEKYGSINTLIMIVFTALITGLINVFFFNSGLLGASGIVFMMILLVSFTNVQGNAIPITFLIVAVMFLGKEIAATMQADNISQAAHIIGGVCGSLFGFIQGKTKSLA